MSVVYWILGVLVVAGVGIAIYEWRSRRILLGHDLDLLGSEQSEADRDLARYQERIFSDTYLRKD